jgi:hypothetical protein
VGTLLTPLNVASLNYAGLSILKTEILLRHLPTVGCKAVIWRLHEMYLAFVLMAVINETKPAECGMRIDHKRKVRVKVKFFLCLTKHHAMKAYWGVEV